MEQLFSLHFFLFIEVLNARQVEAYSYQIYLLFFRNSENKSYSFPNCDFLPNLKLDMYFKFINVGFISLRLVTMTSLKSLIHRFVIRIDLHLFFFYTLVCCNTCIPGVKRPRSITNWTDAKLCTPICIYECVLPCMRTKRLCICKSALIFSTGAR